MSPSLGSLFCLVDLCACPPTGGDSWRLGGAQALVGSGVSSCPCSPQPRSWRKPPLIPSGSGITWVIALHRLGFRKHRPSQRVRNVRGVGFHELLEVSSVAPFSGRVGFCEAEACALAVGQSSGMQAEPSAPPPCSPGRPRSAPAEPAGA